VVPPAYGARGSGVMRGVLTIPRHLLGLFVDDGAFALAILVWLVVTGLLSLSADVTPIWRGPLLFAGLACLLGVACLRAASRHS
jgi:hypothetical protein